MSQQCLVWALARIIASVFVIGLIFPGVGFGAGIRPSVKTAVGECDAEKLSILAPLSKEESWEAVHDVGVNLKSARYEVVAWAQTSGLGY